LSTFVETRDYISGFSVVGTEHVHIELNRVVTYDLLVVLMARVGLLTQCLPLLFSLVLDVFEFDSLEALLDPRLRVKELPVTGGFELGVLTSEFIA